MKSLNSRSCFFLMLLVAIGNIAFAGQIIYVDADATGVNNGSSWKDAYESLPYAFSIVVSGDKIMVAQGTYRPNDGLYSVSRTLSFVLKNGIAVEGGYAGFGESDPNARNIRLYKTTLSGDINHDDVAIADPCDLLTESARGENSYHVVSSCETDASAVLDGFVITGGNANGSSQPLYWGGGIYNENPSPQSYECTTAGPTISNCIIIRNSAAGEGGGMYNRYSCQPQISNCDFIENTALWGGGAIKNDTSNPIITSCSFVANLATDGGGGAIDDEESSPRITNSSFIGNTAEGSGGAIENWMGGCSPTIVNCTFSNNSAVYGNALACRNGVEPSDIALKNCILWDGSDEVWKDDGPIITINYSNIQGGWSGLGGNNINVDPYFANDSYLKSQAGRYDSDSQSWVVDSVTSLCIDAGNKSSSIGLEPYPNGGFVNMGAYGGTAEASKSYFGVSVCQEPIAGDINGDCKVDFVDIAILTSHWLKDNN